MGWIALQPSTFRVWWSVRSADRSPKPTNYCASRPHEVRRGRSGNSMTATFRVRAYSTNDATPKRWLGVLGCCGSFNASSTRRLLSPTAVICWRDKGLR